jgi:hypothetical protein
MLNFGGLCEGVGLVFNRVDAVGHERFIFITFFATVGFVVLILPHFVTELMGDSFKYFGVINQKTDTGLFRATNRYFWLIG